MRGNFINKYRKVVTILLLIMMTITTTEPFMDYALGTGVSVTKVTEEDSEVAPDETINNEEYAIQESVIDEEVELETTTDEDENPKDTEMVSRMSTMGTAMPTYVLEPDSSYSWDKDGATRYTGNNTYVEVPHYMGGLLRTTYDSMFSYTGVKGVKSTNKNIGNMSDMFSGVNSETLDVSQLYTGSVWAMQSMFMNTSAKDLDLSKFDTARVDNMTAMFRGSKAVTINLSSFNTSNVILMERMFQDTKVSNIDISHFDTSKVNNMTGMFSGAEAISVNLGELNTGNVTDMKEMFKGSNAKTLDLSSFNTGKVVNMRDMFQDSQANDLDLTSFNTTKVSDMSNMFNGSQAQRINVSSFNTENVYTMSNMFQNTKASVLDLSNFNTTRITGMSSLFKGSQANTIDVSNFDTYYVTDMSEMFMDTQVTELDLSSFDMRSVNDTTDMFKGAKATKGYARTQGDADILNSSEGKPDYLHFETRYVVPKDSDFLGSTNGTFKYIGKDEYIEIPNIIKEIPVVSYKSMFEGTSVRGVVSTNMNIKDMTRMFYGNTATNLDVSNLDTTGVTTMGSMFEYAHTKEISVKNFDTSKVEYMGYMFKDTKVTDLDLSSFNLVNVKNTEGMFQRSTATQGYARTQADAGKMNTSTMIPSTLKFTVWSILVEPDTTEWTRESINLTVKGESEEVGVDYIDMVLNDFAGRNLLRNGNFENGIDFWTGIGTVIDADGAHFTAGANASWPRAYSNSPIFKNMKKGETYTLTFEAKGHNTGSTTLNIALGSSASSIMNVSAGDYSPYWKKHEITFKTTGDSLSNSDFRLQFWIDGHNVPVSNTRSYRKVKLERGGMSTPFSLAPEDVELINNQKEYEVAENGTYIFRVVDNKGETKEVAHTVSNIDYTNPTAEMVSSPTGWTSQDVTIYVNADDALSGVDSVTLPNGTIVKGNKAEYKVTDNGEYTFKVTDNAGNVSTHTETITNIDKSVPASSAKVLNKEWTRETVDIEVSSEESASGLAGIEMINSPIEGRNYLKDTGFMINATKGKSAFDTQKFLYPVTGLDLNKAFLNKEVRFSYDVHSLGERVKGTGDLGARFGMHGTTRWLDSTGKLPQTTGYPFAESLEGVYNQQRVTMKTTATPPPGYDKLLVFDIALQPFAYPGATNDETWELGRPKLEVGKVSTPWTPAPEDIQLINNKKVYPVATNGLYTFKSTYNNGTTSESSVNVTNIDRNLPTVKVSGNIEDWTEDDDITLTLDASDTQSGVKSITLPDGKVVNSNKATFTANENKDYDFIITDNVGNTYTHTETVNRLMVNYSFYLYDAKGNPIKGAVFELLRDGNVHATAESDSNGLVNFGKVPPTGVYTVRQIKAPNGHVVNPDEKDVEVGDETEPEEFVSYPRGDVLPATGTMDLVLISTVLLGVTGLILYITDKKRKEK